MPVRYLPVAKDDIKDALRWSRTHFGDRALRRYQKLIGVALAEIAADPHLAHSCEGRGLQPGIRLYHLRYSRRRAVVDGQIVRQPRHFIAYLVSASEVVVVRLLHERMEVSKKLEERL